MFSTQQVDFLSEIVAQYDYYAAYYYGSYYDYTVGDTRDNKIMLLCSDEQPTIENGSYIFTDCKYYEITSNKYMLVENSATKQLTPLGSSDLVYSNAVDGAPQLCYTTSSIRNDAPEYVMYAVLVVAMVAIVCKLLFGRG